MHHHQPGNGDCSAMASPINCFIKFVTTVSFVNSTISMAYGGS
jgi:hypothetical protein